MAAHISGMQGGVLRLHVRRLAPPLPAAAAQVLGQVHIAKGVRHCNQQRRRLQHQERAIGQRVNGKYARQ